MKLFKKVFGILFTCFFLFVCLSCDSTKPVQKKDNKKIKSGLSLPSDEGVDKPKQGEADAIQTSSSTSTNPK